MSFYILGIYFSLTLTPYHHWETSCISLKLLKQLGQWFSEAVYHLAVSPCLAEGFQNKLQADGAFMFSYKPEWARCSANSCYLSYIKMISQLRRAIVKCQGEWMSAGYTKQMTRNNHLCLARLNTVYFLNVLLCQFLQSGWLHLKCSSGIQLPTAKYCCSIRALMIMFSKPIMSVCT